MLRKIKDLRGFELIAIDGDVGTIKEFYFDDLDWTILYMVLDSGMWLPGRRILISPASLGDIDWVERKLQVLLTRGDIETSPEIDLHQPITREQEVRYFAHFGWACLWEGELRSTQELIGSQVKSNDNKLIGTVEDLIVDDLYIVRYLILSPKHFDSQQKLVFSPNWIEVNDWSESAMVTLFDFAKIQSAPLFDLNLTIKRDYEMDLYNHFGIKPYWE